MGYLVIEDFRAGVDSRRDPIAGTPGSLYEGINGHITRGGDFEGRKKFVSKYTLPAGTFGLHAVAGGLYVFGSGADPGVPSGVTYQRLQHPDGLAMSAVLWTESFDGKVCAIAKFSDGSIIHFYDGAVVGDWLNGRVRAAMTNNNGIASHLAGLVNGKQNLTASASTNVITITGQAGVPFTITASAVNGGATNDQTATVATPTPAIAGISEVLSKASFAVTGGSDGVPATGSFTVTAGTDGRSKTTLTLGSSFAGTSITSITINGVEVLGATVNSPGTDAEMATAVANQINGYTSSPDYTATASSNVVTVYAHQDAGAGPNGFAVVVTKTGVITVTVGNGGTLAGGANNTVSSVTVDGVEVLSSPIGWLTSNEATAQRIADRINSYSSSPEYTSSVNGAVVSIKAAPALAGAPNGFVVSVTPNGSLTVGSVTNLQGGADSLISSIKIDGVEILGVSVSWSISHSAFATNLATQINNYNSTPEYTAVASGTTVTISAAEGTGATPNGKLLVVTAAGDVTVGSLQNMSGGVTAVSGQAQVSTVTIGGTFEVGDRFTILINGTPYGADGNPDQRNIIAKTFKTKVYGVAGSLLQFSGVNDPTVWNRDNANVPGAGFVNMANQTAGSENLTAVGIYQGNLAVFSRSTIQIEFVDVDDALNQLLQPLENTGTRSPKSVLSFGNSDTFYLDDNGIRSLKARDSSNSAYSSDVGTAIDPNVLAYMKTLTDTQVENAVAVIDEDGRYWLALGSRIFVFSYFPGAKISAWTWYEPNEISAGDISAFAVLSRRIYARAGDTIYLYGGDNNATYPAANEINVVLQTHFLTVGKPATVKKLYGFDAAIQGTWKASVLVDPRNLALTTREITVTGPSYDIKNIPLQAEATHFAPRLVCSAGGYCKVSNLVLHHNLEDDA